MSEVVLCVVVIKTEKLGTGGPSFIEELEEKVTSLRFSLGEYHKLNRYQQVSMMNEKQFTFMFW
jgi:hypothetical protein